MQRAGIWGGSGSRAGRILAPSALSLQVKENNYRGHGDSVDQLCWHPSNPDLFVTASGDKTIRIWDVRTTKCIATVNTKGENINICWSPDGQTIAVGNKDDVVTFIDAKTHRSKAEEQFKFEVNEISWNNDNNMFFLTNGNGCINILSYPELKPIQSINAHPSNCICIKFDPMGKYFATGSADALVSLWDVDELVCVRCFSRLDWPVRTLSFSHDGKMLASASEDHFIDIAEVETGNGFILENSKEGIGWRSAGVHMVNLPAKEELSYAEQNAIRGSLCLSSLWQTCLSCLCLVTG
uniref:THO complex subunit 3 n=1 Tax=Ficedula albicollis TaxID=59894 RepID=A0A803VCE5_FICAL